MKLQMFSRRLCGSWVLSIATACLFAGCYTPDRSHGEVYAKPEKWYAHCDTCVWCKGAFKRSMDAQQAVTQHNIKTHDYLKVAYYDMNKCSR